MSKMNSPISISEIESGIQLCLSNARELLIDVVTLMDANRHSRALSLLIVSIEEFGKANVVASMSRIPANNTKMWKDAWSDFRQHRNKSTWSIMNSFSDEARKDPRVLSELLNSQYEASPMVERIRQVGFYVDYIEGSGWFTPEKVSRTDIEDWIPTIERIDERFSQLNDSGLLSFDALRIQHEVYTPINEKRVRRKDVRPEEWNQLATLFMETHNTYWKRLVDEGIVQFQPQM